jgi:uncharacterized protein YndB with AHSA1/START domain
VRNGVPEAELGRFIDRFTVEYIRVYPHPIERVWRALTEPEELAGWFMVAEIDPYSGGSFRFDATGSWNGAVLAFEPPHLLKLGHVPGYFQYELSEVPGGTRMRFVEHFSPEGEYPFRGDGSPGDGTPWPGRVSGWHEFWDALGAHLDDRPIDSRLAPTEMSQLVAGWVNEAIQREGLDQKMGATVQIGLRRSERWTELNRLYADHMRRTLPREKNLAGASQLGKFLDRFTMEYIRRYAHPIDQVWTAITNPDELAQWFMAPMVWELEAGGTYRFHDKFTGLVELLEPQKLVRFANESGYFEFELLAVPEGTRLRLLIHVSPEELYAETKGDLGGELPGILGAPWKPGLASRWHEFCDSLGDFLDGVLPGSRLPTTEMSELVGSWARQMEEEYGMSPELASRIRRGLRRQEHRSELNEIYRDQVGATLPIDSPAG